MDTLAQSRRPMTLAELARMLALPKSSAHGLLTTLVGRDLARRDAQGNFQLGPRALQWASAYSLQSDVTGAFLGETGTAGALSDETVMLAVLDGKDVLYLACRQGSRPLAVNFRVGGRLPATCTATGKALLATLPAPHLQSFLDAPFARLTRHSINDAASLQKRLIEVRRQGYAIDDEETAEGMLCLGVPVFCASQPEAVAAVAVSLIKAGLGSAHRQRMLTAILALGRRLSERLGAL
jgi:DNA-binding IclR family transcriptional regulator